MSASAPQQPPATTSGSRSRPQARRKANDDNAPYFGPPPSNSASGLKRHAGDKVDGDSRSKRKRVEAHPISLNNSNKRDGAEPEQKNSLVEFVKMPTPVLYRYLTTYDMVPHVHPSPMSAEDPAPPSALEHPYRGHRESDPREASPPTMTTPANRPRRDVRDHQQNRRRSSRLLEEETRSRTPILADVEELHVVLANIVERHFREQPSISGREEVDTLAAFMCAVEKAKAARIKW